MQVRTVRRLTREQRGDDVSERAFDNLLVRREIFQVQNHLCKSKQLMVRRICFQSCVSQSEL